MTETSNSIRSFVAIELPEEVKRGLASVQRDLQERLDRLPGHMGRGIRWVTPEAIHITLKFLGNVLTTQLPLLQEALHASLRGAGGYRCTLSGLGMFPNASRPRVIWIGIAGHLEALADLQRRVEQATVPLGFPSEQRGFNPHLTLARVREEVGNADRRSLGATVLAKPVSLGLSIDVREVSLMRSVLSRGGAQYSRIAAIPI